MEIQSDEKKIQRIREFMRMHDLGVLSTVNPQGLPESAVVGFSETGDFELIIGSFADARKCVNLKTNPFVSFVVGWEQGKTVQLEGEAREVVDQAEKTETIKTHLAKIPTAAKYVYSEEEKIYKIKPRWVRYSDLSVEPWEVLEVKFLK
jgi:general stress protein 26